MALNFSLLFTKYFQKQWNNYDNKTCKLIKNKLILIKQNPFRFPKHESYKFMFKVKLSVEGKYSRLMYAAFMPDSEHITILGVFDRKANYKDFEKLFKKTF
jgi:mRNA-degrading endonuclease RelE of RelBE toxin-antitoxin system